MVYIHVLHEKDDQNSAAVLGILEDIFAELKKDRVNKVYLRSDQAGCYKSSTNVAAMKDVMARTGMQVKSVSFSEAQAGKSLCDTYSSEIKSKLLDYVDAGGNVESPEHIMEAIDWALYAMEANVKGSGTDAELGIRSRLISFQSSTKQKQPCGKKPSVPQMRNFNAFEFQGSQVRAWHHRSIGEGQVIESKYLNYDISQSLHPVVNRASLRYWWGKIHHDETVTRTHQEHDMDETEEATAQRSAQTFDDVSVFSCPEPTCVKTFMKYGNLVNHIVSGKHVMKAVKETLTDFAINAFKCKLEGIRGEYSLPEVKELYSSSLQDHHERVQVPVEKGWALPPKVKSSKFSDKQTKYLNKIFDDGARTGKKINPKKVEQQMRNEKTQSGNRRFLPGERLRERQIASYFTRRHQMMERKCGGQPTRLCTVEDDPTEEGDPDLDFEVSISI